MAIGWVAAIPWGAVLKAAPEVIEGAKKLWDTVRKPSSTSALQVQMQESSELIKILADQNGQLVARVELHRKRLFLLTIVTVVSIITSGTCLILLLTKCA